MSSVVVTKATVETEPWVKTAMNSGLMEHYVGLSGNSLKNPLKDVSESKFGAMPYFMAHLCVLPG